MVKQIKNLNIFTIKFPLSAIVSILHRFSGVGLFLAMPLLTWALSESLASKQSFNALKAIFISPGGKFILWLLAGALIYHILAGTRHLLLDLGYGRSKKVAKLTALAVLVLFAFSIIYLGLNI